MPGAIHHVMNRCNRQEHLLEHDDFQDFCALLSETKKRFYIRIFAYALLHNHYHLLLKEVAAGSMTKMMHWINGVSATRYNIRHGTRGHLWQGRFGNRLLGGENDEELLHCMAYIDLNPARAGLAPNVTDWPFCSAKTHTKNTPDHLVDPVPVSLTDYERLLDVTWKRTQQLKQALQGSHRTAVRQWIRGAPNRSFIPYAKEIGHLLGHNFRRLIPNEKERVQKGQALPYNELYKGA